MSTMRAMRRLRPDPVPDELLEKLVEAATWAPSGSNLQAFEFVVVTDRAVMAQLADLWRKSVELYLKTVGGVTPAAQDPGGRRALEYQRDHLAVTPVGWPKGRFGPVTRRPAREAIHRDRW